MQSDEDFNVKFVYLVKKHKCLYDKKLPEYRNKDEQEKAWAEIAKETRESVSHCKERWRNLRACLSRYIKQQNSSDPQHKPYYLSDHMQFLLPFLKSNKQYSKNSLTTYEIQPDMHLDIKTSDPEDTNDQDYNTSYDGNYSMSAAHAHRLSETETTISAGCGPNIHVALDTGENEPEVLFSTSTERIQHDTKPLKLENPQDIPHSSRPNYGETADMEFFRSILPDIQGMNALQKRKFKIGVLELIDDIYVKYPEKRPYAHLPSSN